MAGLLTATVLCSDCEASVLRKTPPNLSVGNIKFSGDPHIRMKANCSYLIPKSCLLSCDNVPGYTLDYSVIEVSLS